MSMVETDLTKLIHDKLVTPVPPGWTAKQDMEHFEDTLGEPEGESYYEAAETYVFGETELLDEVVNAGIDFYSHRRGRAHVKLAEDVSLMERLEMLERLVLQSSKSRQHLRFFTTDVQLCRDVEMLRQRTMAKYEVCGENTWLYELVDLGDWLGTAALELDGSLLCGNAEGDYKSPFSPA